MSDCKCWSTTDGQRIQLHGWSTCNINGEQFKTDKNLKAFVVAIVVFSAVTQCHIVCGYRCFKEQHCGYQKKNTFIHTSIFLLWQSTILWMWDGAFLWLTFLRVKIGLKSLVPFPWVWLTSFLASQIILDLIHLNHKSWPTLPGERRMIAKNHFMTRPTRNIRELRKLKIPQITNFIKHRRNWTGWALTEFQQRS